MPASEYRLGRRDFLRAVFGAATEFKLGSRFDPQVSTTLPESQRKPFVLEGVKDLPELSQQVLKTHPRRTNIGLANGNFPPSTEWNFRSPLNPIARPESNYPLWYEVDGERFLALTNTQTHRPLREGEKPTMVMRDLYDATVWGIHKNRTRATVIIELDEDPDSLKELPGIIDVLDWMGVQDITIGNEHSNPFASYRNHPLWYVKAGWALRERLSNPGRDLSLPPLVFYKNAQDSLRELLRSFADEPSTFIFPVTTVKFNYYGAVNKLLPAAYGFRQIMDDNRADHLKLSISELGFPGGDRKSEHIPDEILATCFLPQVLLLAVASRVIDKVDVYSFYDGGKDYFSLTWWTKNGWDPKLTYRSFDYTGRLTGGLRDSGIAIEDGYVAVHGKRFDGINFTSYWSERNRKRLRKPNGLTQVDVYG